VLLLAGCASPPLAPGVAGFGVIGDAPYSARDIAALDRVIDEMNAEPLAFVVHVGDIGTSSLAQGCSDAWLRERKAQFARIRHRFVLVAGDNEWSDCARHGLDPVARLRKWREVFCEIPGEWCEHRRWEAGGRVFVTLNVPGGDNNRAHAEHAPRMQAVSRWLEEAARLAEARDGLVIFMQANPFETLAPGGYAGLRAQLAALARRMPGRVMLVHGHTHLWRDDEPLPGLRRIEVWGSPIVSWRREPVSEPPSR
jgi:predicted phosphodiesterase